MLSSEELQLLLREEGARMKLPEWLRLVLFILGGIAFVCLIGLMAVGPLLLALMTVSLKPLLLYVPFAGAAVGLCAYLDTGGPN